MVPQSRDYFRFARAALYHFAQTKRIWWDEYNRLMHDLLWHEGRFAGCEGKISFDTFDQAEAMAKRRMGKDGHKHRKPYRCPVCRLIHLAGSDSNARRAHDRLKAKRRGTAYA